MSKKYRQKIQEVLQIFGPAAPPTIARRCIETKVFDAGDLAKAELDWATRQVTKALRAPDEIGLPYAGQTESEDKDGKRIWAQRGFWKEGDYQRPAP